MAGLLYGPDGTEITGAQLAAARAGGASEGAARRESPETAAEVWSGAHAAGEEADAPSAFPSRALFERSVAAFGFTLGESGPLVLLFGDAACRWSRAAAARLGREAIAGRLRLRVVPVAVLGAGAARQAAAIAASPSPHGPGSRAPNTRPAGAGRNESRATTPSSTRGARMPCR